VRSEITSKLTTKFKVTIPEKIRVILSLHPGDYVVFEIAKDEGVFIRKAAPIDFKFVLAIEKPLDSEWLSNFDENAYRDL